MFDSKDIQEINEYMRFWLGDVTQDVLSDDTLNYIIQLVIDKDPNYTGCDVLYYSAVDVLKWLVRKQETGTTVGTGEIKSRKEKVGQVDVSVTYDVGTNSSGRGGWESVLEDLLNNPFSIGCLITKDDVNTSKVVIGGVSHKEYNKVKSNPDNKSGWEMTSPYRENLNKNRNLIG